MSKKGGGGGGGTQQVTQTSEPPAYLLPYLKQAEEAASNIYNKGTPPLFAGQTYAPINSTQQQALNQTLAYGNSGASPYATHALDALDASATSTPGQGNPYLDQLLQTYGEKANQMVASNFNSGGRYGSGSHAAAAGTAISNATLPILAQQYNTDMTNKLGSAAMLPSLATQADQQNLAKAQAVGSVGDTYAGQDQNAINDAMARFAYENGGGDNEALNNFISQLSAAPNSGGSTTGTTTTAKNAGIGSTIGNITAGLGTIGGLGTGLSSFLGGSSALAGMLGGTGGTLGTIASLAGFFSDERLKENIIHVGTENGHNIYEFNYRHAPTDERYIGVMAQEVEKTHPEAIAEVNGFKSVNYNTIGVRFRKVGASQEAPSRATAPASVGGHVEAGAGGCIQGMGV